MCVEITDVRVGEPQACGGVTAFPLFADHSSSLDYLLAGEAMAAGTLAVREVSEAGEILCLLIDNGGDRPALFVEGEEVRGGKQNRVLCSSVLVSVYKKRSFVSYATSESPQLSVDTLPLSRSVSGPGLEALNQCSAVPTRQSRKTSSSLRNGRMTGSFLCSFRQDRTRKDRSPERHLPVAPMPGGGG